MKKPLVLYDAHNNSPLSRRAQDAVISSSAMAMSTSDKEVCVRLLCISLPIHAYIYIYTYTHTNETGHETLSGNRSSMESCYMCCSTGPDPFSNLHIPLLTIKAAQIEAWGQASVKSFTVGLWKGSYIWYAHRPIWPCGLRPVEVLELHAKWMPGVASWTDLYRQDLAQARVYALCPH